MSNEKKQRIFMGTVVSDSRDKTISVEILSKKPHDLYKKFIRKRQIFHVHDEKNEAKKNDRVEFFAHRPFSKTKCWLLKNIIK